MERLLGTEDITERLPFSLSKIQEMAKLGEIPMIIFPGSRKYVILESVFEDWIRGIYRDGFDVLDQRQAVCEGDTEREGISPTYSGNYTIRNGKVVSSLRARREDRKARHARGERQAFQFDEVQ